MHKHFQIGLAHITPGSNAKKKKKIDTEYSENAWYKTVGYIIKFVQISERVSWYQYYCIEGHIGEQNLKLDHSFFHLLTEFSQLIAALTKSSSLKSSGKSIFM